MWLSNIWKSDLHLFLSFFVVCFWRSCSCVLVCVFLLDTSYSEFPLFLLLSFFRFLLYFDRFLLVLVFGFANSLCCRWCCFTLYSDQSNKRWCWSNAQLYLPLSLSMFICWSWSLWAVIERYSLPHSSERQIKVSAPRIIVTKLRQFLCSISETGNS